jgi:hypothetical protein
VLVDYIGGAKSQICQLLSHDLARLFVIGHQEKSKSASTSLEALGNRKVAWSPRTLLKVVRTASVIDSPHQVLVVRVCHWKRLEAL